MSAGTLAPPPGGIVAVPRPRAWLVGAAAMFCIGWGGNQFTPLLMVYRDRDHYSQVDVDVFLGAYVFGLVPGLLLASALSDRHGRRPLMIAGLVSSALGSAVLACGGVGGYADILAGRLLSGVAIGIAMAVGTSWVSELSRMPFDPAAGSGTGARRASISLTLGLAIGPASAGLLAQWAPHPLVWPYVVQLVLCVPAFVAVLASGVETRFDDGGASLLQRLRVPRAGHRRFLRVILPMAPWVFSAAAIAYAIVPQLVDSRVGHGALLFTTGLTVATLGCGVLVQPLARRLDDVSTARAVVVSLVVMTVGIGMAALTAATRSPWLAVAVAILLGAGYGIAVVSGLLEVQRIAHPDDLAGLTGVYYALCYVGFLLPAILAGLSHWAGYPAMLVAVALGALACTAVAASGWSKHLPAR